MDHLCGTCEPTHDCIQRLCTYTLVQFSEWIYRFSERLKRLRSLHLSSMEFSKDIKRAYFKILQGFNVVWHYLRLILIFYSEI